MPVLGIETSCDETAAAVIDWSGTVRSSVVASQVVEHAPFGGVVPEIAARRHLENLDRVVEEALERAGIALRELEGIAVTRGPGLIGCLLVGVTFARTLGWALERPVVGVNHLEGHIASGWLTAPDLPFPALALVVSGGHTALWRVRGAGDYLQVARTRDDAAGEAFDKVAKMLGLRYPGGPELDALAESGDPHAFPFGALRLKGAPGFSFSGYKTAARQHMERAGLDPLQSPDDPPPAGVRDLAASFRHAVVREIVRVARKAIAEERPRSLVLAGGVAANRLLRREITSLADEFGLALAIPPLEYCGDNAAMIALAGLPRLRRGENDLETLDAAAHLPLGGPEAARTSRRHR
ncbi:MAG: tRNA (adenosine(37)-N6)-threonylcarbamoyltransferase complex transferase subunit TsaD [Acidobacteria bacterium]|nr:MAG: tRNA (adenosine(37)-N6)-threonylcarbamoyltransferase complex transferase subunit TsaD [Acidobacteriota bacterium]